MKATYKSPALALVFTTVAATGALLSSTALAYDSAYKLIPGGSWNVVDGPIHYELNADGSDDIADGSDLEAVRNAFRAWACVEGSTVRFAEDPGSGPKTSDLSDGINSVFWDETGELGLGPATLGVTIGTVGQETRAAADIIFNGKDTTWSTGDPATGTDVTSVVLHEIGHFVGLDHPCDGDAPGESNCNGADRSVMTPTYPGGLLRAPRPDDVAGLRALYPTDDPTQSSCEGPFRVGERCGCNDDCVDGLVCANGLDGTSICSRACSADAATCGAGFACVLSARVGEAPAPGRCLALSAGNARLPPGSVCAASGECLEGICLAVSAVGRSVCRSTCAADADCGAQAVCSEGVCLGDPRDPSGLICEDSVGGCGCSASGDAGPRAAFVGLGGMLATLGLLLRRRRSSGVADAR